MTSQPQRTAVLEKFSSHKGRLVLLISLKAGGVGLNLVAASRVFMLDPWWSFAVEAQAIDRVHLACGGGGLMVDSSGGTE